MKRTLLSITCFFAYIFSLQAQTLYGVTFNGGNYGGGTINKFTTATSNLVVPTSFETFAASPTYTNFIQASDGKLYGLTAFGGRSGVGVIFSYDPSSSTYTMLYNFDDSSGVHPEGSLLLASDGKLYGMTFQGGTDNVGVIFSFDPVTSTYNKLRDFDTLNGANPSGSLTQGTDGKLYGMTSLGGLLGSGVIFSYDPLSSTYTKLKDFGIGSGAYPYGSLLRAGDGKFYGMTLQGGLNGDGAVFSYDPSSSTYTKLMDFDSTNGANPSGNFVQAIDGKLYGMTEFGGSDNAGLIFSFDPVSLTYTKLKDFDSTNGANPQGSLIQASDGNLYGMTYQGGSSALGVVFSIDPVTSTFTNLQNFDNTNGGHPQGSLMQASNGKLYGMTLKGGVSGIGIIFSFDPPTTTYTKVKDFGTNVNGSKVSSGLLQAADGKLYGMTVYGGSAANGIIFSFDPATSTFTKLQDFDKTNGANPNGSLIQASNGKLYGLTAGGGSNSNGVVFSFDPATATYSKLLDFDSTNGAKPYGSLVQASDGKLYGMTANGGSSNNGVIFSYDPVTAIYTKLLDFNGTIGSNPNGSLVQAGNGKLYGMTLNGGSGRAGTGYGVIFSYDPLTATYTKLLDCDTATGASPYGSLIQASDGQLYGLTSVGGSNDFGVIFSLDPASSGYTVKYDFDNTNGAGPYGNLLQASDGKLYGMTANGGSNSFGVVFSFIPSSSTYTKLIDYDDTNGSNPYIGSAFIEDVSGPLPVTLITFTGKNTGIVNRLSWKVDNEKNLDYYELQRGDDGQNFKAITQIKAAGNNDYSYNDPVSASSSSLYYYRLKNMDKDGKYKYSAIIKIRTDLKGFAVVNPNPFKDRLVVNVASSTQDKVTFIITDINGRQLYKENKLLSPGTNVVEIFGSDRLSKGTYLLTIIESQQTQTIKVVKGN